MILRFQIKITSNFKIQLSLKKNKKLFSLAKYINFSLLLLWDTPRSLALFKCSLRALNLLPNEAFRYQLVY